ncbi:MAG: hypothetical protein WC617_15300 [Rhodanobacter sp.]|jgi:hypothetical protein
MSAPSNYAWRPMAVMRPDGPMTISIGLAVVMPDERVKPLLAHADKPMRQAKKSGHDKVVAAADCVTAWARRYSTAASLLCRMP